MRKADIREGQLLEGAWLNRKSPVCLENMPIDTSTLDTYVAVSSKAKHLPAL